MKNLLDDYIFSDSLRYEGHKLIYRPQSGEPVVLGGILGAALLCARLLNTEEQTERGLILDEALEYDSFITRYEQEVIADDWGYIDAELEQLDLAYLDLFSNEQMTIETICPNKRQLSIAMDIVSTYMRRVAVELYKAHIYELVPWQMPFAQWLFNAAYAEPRRQRFLQMDWTEPALVHDLACYMDSDTPDEPLVYFESEEAADILARYWDWLWNFAQKDAAIFPDANVRMAEYKESILRHETDWDFIKPEMKDFPQEQINLFRKWMNQWTDFVKSQIEPKKEITFWTKEVTEEQQEALLDYIKIQERQPQRYKCLAVGVYSLRQLGYITYNIAPSSIAKWLSERLQNDYSSKTGLYQFRRAWNELRRFHPAVQDEVAHLAELGVKSINVRARGTMG